MKYVEVTCGSCGKNFDKPLNEYNRSKKLGRGFFCSRSCSGRKFHGHLTPHAGKFNDNLLKGRPDLSPFQSELTRARKRADDYGVDCTITVQDLEETWNAQYGVCAYSGFPLFKKRSGSNDPRYAASLDRIDSALGYVKGNIQFVSIAMNCAKGEMSHSMMIELIDDIRNWEVNYASKSRLIDKKLGNPPPPFKTGGPKVISTRRDKN